MRFFVLIVDAPQMILLFLVYYALFQAFPFEMISLSSFCLHLSAFFLDTTPLPLRYHPILSL